MKLLMRGVHKAFPGVKAVDGVTFGVRAGEVQGLLGENGAGKTTLMNILYGLYKADRGEILIDGRAVCINRPPDSIRLGVGMVHQHFMLAPEYDVLENIVCGTPLPGSPWLSLDSVRDRVRDIVHEFGLEVPLETRARELPVGVQQRLEIVKALYRGADILILDEPTAVLTPQETDLLFQVIRRMKQEGLSVIFISHKLEEVTSICDRITVMRDGRVVDTVKG
ncbi:MAG: ATP-binding cassette domain-containing protein, partial [Actinobacteria bacterium]|nr:ATP-binding cassette domain-containing protein [Actinomycetota bacterium]